MPLAPATGSEDGTFSCRASITKVDFPSGMGNERRDLDDGKGFSGGSCSSCSPLVDSRHTWLFVYAVLSLLDRLTEGPDRLSSARTTWLTDSSS